MRSQRGPMASTPFHTPPVSAAYRFVVRPSKLQGPPSASPLVPAPLVFATCWCGQRLDSRGYTRGACAHAGVAKSRQQPSRSGLPLFHGAQLAVDTTMVSAVRADETPGSSVQNGTEPPWTKPATRKNARTRADVRRALDHGTVAPPVRQLRVANLVETHLLKFNKVRVFQGGHLKTNLAKSEA